VNNVMTNTQSEKAMTAFYHQLIGSSPPISEEIIEKKSFILFNFMNGELDNLVRLYIQTIDPTIAAEAVARLRADIADYLIHCPVYRYYDDIPVMNRDRNKKNTSSFYRRAMQFTGPLMAKGVEDTLMYTYHRFIGHNDVGDSPEYFGSTADEFHRQMKERQDQWPMAMNTTSTHDTKRGEDARARLQVLSDLPTEWIELCTAWAESNQSLKKNGAPGRNDEYFIYQTLIATWPFTDEEREIYSDRLGEYLSKAFREGKINSGWSSPNKEYEESAIGFTRNIFKEKTFSDAFFLFLDKVKDYGIVNSLVQTILKFTCPGIPDLYQGTEMWDLSLVDPDNRRRVNYQTRIAASGRNQPIMDLWEQRDNAEIKLRLTQKLLELRKTFKELFHHGEYLPLSVSGTYRDHILAFQRIYGQQRVIVVVPIHSAAVSPAQTSPFTIEWKDTAVSIDGGMADTMTDLVSDKMIAAKKEMNIRELFSRFPMSVLFSESSPAKQ
jgi:malto-oligosyltrehalose synthase